MKTAFLFINGIMNDPGDARAWTDRASTWIGSRLGMPTDKFEYFCAPLTRRIFQQKRARLFAEDIDAFAKCYAAVVTGHSNGCDIILRSLHLTKTTIKEIHLISGACEADFEKNGLNKLMTDGKVGRVVCYIAEKDEAMKWAKLSQTLFGWLGLGYGTLGLHGPRRVKHKELVSVIRQKDFGHSTWFKTENFEWLMRQISENHDKEN